MTTPKSSSLAFWSLQEEAKWSVIVLESRRQIYLVISPSFFVLSLLNHITLQLIKCHASEEALAPASQTFYFSIFLSLKGHYFSFTAAQRTHCSTQLFLAPYLLIKLFFRISGKSKIKSSRTAWGLAVYDKHCSNGLIWFVFHLIIENTYLHSHTHHSEVRERGHLYSPFEK